MSNENSVSSQSSDSGLELRRAIDTASKFIAILVIFLYICGFLITSVHYFSYGFSEINPFRPRIFAAGAWFLFFVGMPIGLAKFSQLWGKTRGRFELPTKLGFYLTLSITLAMVLQPVFYDFGYRVKDLFSIYSLVVVGSIFSWPGAPSIRVLCEWVGDHKPPRRLFQLMLDPGSSLRENARKTSFTKNHRLYSTTYKINFAQNCAFCTRFPSIQVVMQVHHFGRRYIIQGQPDVRFRLRGEAAQTRLRQPRAWPAGRSCSLACS
jgi:hypothetical protein